MIRRDDFGVPHILAQTEEAAAFAFGYAQAEDHAVEIARRYVAARGEAALHFGQGGVENDFNIARFDNMAEARRGLDEVSDVYRQVIAAYAAGVNAYVSQHRSELPAWMPKITAVDVLAGTRASAVNDLGGPALPRQLRQKYEGESVPGPASEWIDQPNFTYADADGNILYLWNGRVPVRQNGGDYSLDVEVTRSADLWSRLHSIDELPQRLNPAGGYIQNANNPPQFVSLQDPIDMTRYPSYFERGSLALRPQLALDLLERAKKMTVADVIRLKYTTRMLLAERVRPELLAAVQAAVNPSEELRAGAATLESWDGTVAAESRGAVLFQAFWDAYTNAVRQPFAQRWSPLNPASTPAGLSDRAEAVRQLEAAVRATRIAYGSESVAWGDVNRFRLGSVDLPGDGANGTYGTFRVMRFDRVQGSQARIAGKLPDGPSLLGFGDAWVLLVDFAEPVTGWSVLAYGQTTNPDSRHSADQIRIFAAHDLRRAWYTEAEIKEHTTREYRPAGR